MNQATGTGDAAAAGPPPFNASLVGKVARYVEIANVELVGAHYSRTDDGLEATTLPADAIPDFSIAVAWALDDGKLTCVLTFGTTFDMDDDEGEDVPAPPYQIVGRFRLSYSLAGDASFSDEELDQFAHWNAVFNAWPYWREFVSSMVNRGQLPRFLVPVMGVPKSAEPVADAQTL